MNTHEIKNGVKSMAPTSQADRNLQAEAFEAQIRECFGRVAYSHKTHEKCADLLQSKLRVLKNTQIAISVAVSGTLIVTVVGQETVSKLVATVLSAVLAGINLYFKNYNYGEMAQAHKEAADQLWNVRESYVSLLTDMETRAVTMEKAMERREKLQKDLGAIYSKAPRTNANAYKQAQRALKISEDLTFSAEEIDAFLPGPLRRAQAKEGQRSRSAALNPTAPS